MQTLLSANQSVYYLSYFINNYIILISKLIILLLSIIEGHKFISFGYLVSTIFEFK